MIPTGARTRRRILALLCAMCALFCMLVCQLFNLQVIISDGLQQRAQKQWVAKARVSARRGTISDRSGVPLAISATAYAVSASPRQVADSGAFAREISSIIGTDAAAIEKKISDKSKGGVTLRRQLPRETARQIMKRREELNRRGIHALDGLYLEEDQLRVYPMGRFLTQVLGLTTTDGVGQSGMEKQLDKYLRGRDGAIISEVDGHGNPLPYSAGEYTRPIDGCSVRLTIDAAIQGFAERAMRECYEVNDAVAVQAIVTDVNTGEILAMVSKPDFDPNDPPRADLPPRLTERMRIRPISDVYEPGSTFKALTSAAALETGVTTPDEQFYCSGSVTVEGSRIRCWGKPHGAESMAKALQNSCNPVFVELGLRLGTARLYSYLRAFGLGRKTGVDISGEAAGILIAEKNVKTVDLARIGFGQSVAVTPLQLINAIGAIANGGRLMRPYIISEITGADGEIVRKTCPEAVGQPINEATSRLMRRLMTDVVEYGGGKNARIEGISVAGKTGTAQIYKDGAISREAHIGSFVGFAPSDAPQIAVLVVVHEAKRRPDFGSVTAAPFARQIMLDTLAYRGIYPELPAGEAPAHSVAIPNVMGLTAREATQKLRAAGLDSLIEGGGSCVAEQFPKAGAEMRQGSLVILHLDGASVEEAETDVEVPDVTGRSIVEAARLLSSCALRLNIDGSGLAAAQSPAAGARVPVGAEVRVRFALP